MLAAFDWDTFFHVFAACMLVAIYSKVNHDR